MEKRHKDFIVNELIFRIDKQSAKKVATQAKVSPATISQMINHNWELIKDELWLKVKVNLNIDWNWVIANTSNLQLITDLLEKTQKGSMSICISDKAGLGKTTAYEYYQKMHKNVILIRCKNYWSKKSFARHQLIACGLDAYGTTEEMIERFLEHLSKLIKPVVIYDQFDKLKEPQKDLFMDAYNELDGHCGFLLSGVQALKKSEKKGCNLKRIGYEERFSRYGSKFISLNRYSLIDVAEICKANGISDKNTIKTIYDECLGDGRRVKRLIQQHFLIEAEKAA